MVNVLFALMVVLCVSCSGLPLLEARALHGQNPTNKAQIERIEELLKAGVVPEWQQSAQAGRRLHGQNPTNKAQIERIEELLKVRAVL
jgi:hypothetical protein